MTQLNPWSKRFGILVRDRSQYKRFDQALTNDLLQRVVIEPRVLNRDGKEFPFLVARTKQKGKVNLLINAGDSVKTGISGNRRPSPRDWQKNFSGSSVKPRPNPPAGDAC